MNGFNVIFKLSVDFMVTLLCNGTHYNTRSFEHKSVCVDLVSLGKGIRYRGRAECEVEGKWRPCTHAFRWVPSSYLNITKYLN
jgi:hypothetical protein